MMLCQNKVIRAARAAQRQMRGKIDLLSVARYINSMGYITVFYNDEEPNPVLELYNKTEYAKTENGFTLMTRKSGGFGFVFINNEKGYGEQLKTLIHEAGHIALKHFEDKPAGFINERLLEMEADTFAYILLHCPQKSFIRVICSALSRVHSFAKDYYAEIKGEFSL